MRKRKLYLSELIGKYIPKTYQFIKIIDEKHDRVIYHENSISIAINNDIPKELLDKQVIAWEVINTNTIYIYI